MSQGRKRIAWWDEENIYTVYIKKKRSRYVVSVKESLGLDRRIIGRIKEYKVNRLVLENDKLIRNIFGRNSISMEVIRGFLSG